MYIVHGGLSWHHGGIILCDGVSWLFLTKFDFHII